MVELGTLCIGGAAVGIAVWLLTRFLKNMLENLLYVAIAIVGAGLLLTLLW